MNEPAPFIVDELDPENPGWHRWRMTDPTRFNEAVVGKMIARVEPNGQCRLRMTPQRHHTNAVGSIHGGLILALIDISLFSAVQFLRGIDAERSLTVALDTQFIGAGDAARPLDSVAEILRETRRLVFLRGLVEQDGVLVASFGATVRKPVDKT